TSPLVPYTTLFRSRRLRLRLVLRLRGLRLLHRLGDGCRRARVGSIGAGVIIAARAQCSHQGAGEGDGKCNFLVPHTPEATPLKMLCRQTFMRLEGCIFVE